MTIDNAALRYWTASKTLLNPATSDDDVVNAAVQLALMAERSPRALALRINRSLDLANQRGLFADADDDYAMEA